LHDTLLQHFHGLLLQFQAALNLLPDRPRESRQVLARAIDRAAEAITEGRDTVHGLRISTLETNSLAEALRALAGRYGARLTGLFAESSTLGGSLVGRRDRDQLARASAEARARFEAGRSGGRRRSARGSDDGRPWRAGRGRGRGSCPARRRAAPRAW